MQRHTIVRVARERSVTRVSLLGSLTILVLFTVVWLAALPSQAAVPASTTALQQLPDPNDCVGNTEPGLLSTWPCASAFGIARPTEIAVSSDGRNVYVGSFFTVAPGGENTGSIAVFARSQATDASRGALTQLAGANACLTFDADNNSFPDTNGNDGDPGAMNCALVNGAAPQRGAGYVTDIVVSPDGAHVYVTTQVQGAPTQGGILVFDRSTTEGPAYGALTYKQCYTQSMGGGCVAGGGAEPTGIDISADGTRVVAVGTGELGSVVSFSRNPTTGLLTFRSCAERGAALTGCANNAVRGMQGPVDVDLSSDGRTAYIASGNHPTMDGVAVVKIAADDSGTPGTISQPVGAEWCIVQDGSDGCADGRGLLETRSLALSPDGQHLYVRSNNNGVSGSGAIATMSVAAADSVSPGSITQVQTTAGCISADINNDGTPYDTDCAADAVLGGGIAIRVSPDGESLYTTSGGPASSVQAFERAAGNGALTRPATAAELCLEMPGSDDLPCPDGSSLELPMGIATSADNHSVYVASFYGRSVDVLRRSIEAPVCTATTKTTNANTPTSVQLPCTDEDGDTFTRSIVTAPARGTLSAINGAGSVTYTPPKNHSGKVTFTFRATDPYGPSTLRTATITVRDTIKPRIAGAYVAPRPVVRPRSSNLVVRTSEKALYRMIYYRSVNGLWRKAHTHQRWVAAGTRSIKLTKTIPARKLRQGSWRVHLRATDPAGNRSAVRRVRFTRS